MASRPRSGRCRSVRLPLTVRQLFVERRQRLGSLRNRAVQSPQRNRSLAAERICSRLAELCCLEDGGHVLLAVAGLYSLVEAAGDGFGDERVEPSLGGGFEDEAGVLRASFVEKLVGKSSSIIIFPFIWA